ncbi:porin [Octadecabacter sp.]|nr:porin [Octadecabacter sp.]
MFYKAGPAAIGLAALSTIAISTTASAQSVTGGELTIDAYSFRAGDNESTVNYSGALEYGINRNFSVAGDLALYDFTLLDDSIFNVTVHGIYHVNDQTSVGVLIGNDNLDGDDTTFYGLEGGFEANQLTVEGYFAFYDDNDDSTVIGVSGGYQITDAISAIGTVGYGDIDNNDVTRISAGAEYDFQGGPSIYAEIGNVDTDDDNSVFIGLGAKVEFGAARGTTFDRRGISPTLLPFF